MNSPTLPPTLCRRSSSIRGVPPVPCFTGSCSVAPIGASELVPSLEARIAELSISFGLISLGFISVPTSNGDLKVRQTITPCLVQLQYNWEVARYPRGCRLRQTNPLPFIP
jgi:hypothetical protein